MGDSDLGGGGTPCGRANRRKSLLWARGEGGREEDEDEEEGGRRRKEGGRKEGRRWGRKKKQNHHLGVRKNMHQVEDIFRNTPRCICAYYSSV